MTTISAETILRSRNNSSENVLTTLLLRYPRWIHAELMTHRVFSRNSASSRAIPIKKLIQDVIDNPAVPLFWGKNQPGMQAFEETDELISTWKLKETFTDDNESLGFSPTYSKIKYSNEEAWLNARDFMVDFAKQFADSGYHKQIVNRLLEPFAHITVLVSSTEWDNFLELRNHPDAEPHIELLAKEILKCLENGPIQNLDPDEWHMPFITKDDENSFEKNDLIKMSVSKCASTSYKTVDGFDMSMEKSIDIFNKLIVSKPMHASPAEHVARADYYTDAGWLLPQTHGNFNGFSQLRHLIKVND
jgi:thymidylate synthase ThyX